MNAKLCQSVLSALPGIVLLLCAEEVRAAPANDHYASRINLGNAATVSTTGTNVDATMEAGEDDFGGVAGASVWYEWTAPTTGWVTVSTYGSELDTVIGIYTGGATIASLTRGGFNDGDFLIYNGGFGYPTEFDPDAGNHPSRLYFMAQAGTTYKIAVCGWYFDLDIDMNTFNLEIEYETPAGRVTSATVSPDPVNVTASSQAVNVTVDVEVDSPPSGAFFLGQILVYPPGSSESNHTNTAYQMTLINNAQRISGTASAGTYQVGVTIPLYAAPGDWLVEVFIIGRTASGKSINWLHSAGTDLMEDFVIALPAQDTRLAVQNTGPADTTAPVLQSFSATPGSANVTSGSQTVSMSMRITDDVSGLEASWVYLSLEPLNGEMSMGTDPLTLVSGSATDGIYSSSTTIPQGFPSGTYYWRLNVKDYTGNRRTVTSHPVFVASPFPSGSTPTFVITGSVAYEAWKFGKNFGFPTPEDGLLDDPNDDGTTNLACYAFNLDPSLFQASVMPAGGFSGLPLITMTGVGGSQRLSIQFVRRKASANSGLTYLPQFGDSLAETGPGSFSNATGTPIVTDIDSVWERVVIEDTATGGARRFGRVKVSYTPPSP